MTKLGRLSRANGHHETSNNLVWFGPVIESGLSDTRIVDGLGDILADSDERNCPSTELDVIGAWQERNLSSGTELNKQEGNYSWARSGIGKSGGRLIRPCSNMVQLNIGWGRVLTGESACQMYLCKKYF